jgi:hypothetical protein
MPAKVARFSDPSFSTTLQRITEKKDGYQGPGIENEYSKMDPSNSDSTLLMLRGNAAAYYLYDPNKCELLRKVTDFDKGEFTEPEPRWDRTDPKLFYYIRDTELRGYDTDSNRSSMIHDFKKDFPKAAYVTTKSEGDASLDRRFWCFMVEGSGDKLMAVICYDKAEDRVVGRKIDGFPDSLNWVGMSMSGEHCIIGYEDKAIYTQAFQPRFPEDREAAGRLRRARRRGADRGRTRRVRLPERAQRLHMHGGHGVRRRDKAAAHPVRGQPGHRHARLRKLRGDPGVGAGVDKRGRGTALR